MTAGDLGPLEDLVALTELTRLTPAGRLLRPLHGHEARARIRFDQAQLGVDAIAGQMLSRLLADRGRLLELVAAEARRQLTAAPHARGVDARALLLALGDTRHPLILLPGLREVVNAAAGFHLAALRDAAALGGLHVRAEARAQGVPVAAPPAALAGPDDPAYRPIAGRPPPNNPDLDAELAARAAATAEGPLVDTAIVLRNYALNLPATSFGYGSFIDHVLAAGAASSTRGLETDAARVPAQQAWGLGRQAEAEAVAGEVGEPAEVYASELLDGRTCPSCRSIDGTRFDDRAAGDEAYPAGYYALCQGGPRCRGTLVYIWSEAAPSVR